MSWSDPFVSAQQYRDRSIARDERADGVLELHLKSTCRYVETALGAGEPRRFGRSAAATVLYADPLTSCAARIPDTVSLTEVAIDTDGDYAYGTVIAPADYLLLPRNAATYLEPFTRLELIKGSLGIISASTYLPEGRRSGLRLTGVFGWPEVPEPMIDLVVMICRQIRDLEKSGITMTIQAMETAVQMAPGASAIMKDLKRKYGRQAVVL